MKNDKRINHKRLMIFKFVRISTIFIIIFLFSSQLLAKREHPEKWYQLKWCEAHEGQVEVVLPDGSLVKSLIS
jgi:hypothetical protein